MDLYFIHCPFYFDFRKDFVFSGSENAGIPSTSVFEMYPIGLISLADILQKNNYKVQIINLALKMIIHRRFNIHKFLKKLNAKIFAFDLHWMIHAQGSLEIAKLIKKYHPNSYILFGGFTASYFHKELMQNYPFIDFIIRGDSAEYPLLKLMNNLRLKKRFDLIPNLVWRDGKRVKINNFNHVPNVVEYEGQNFPKIFFKMFLTSRDLDFFSYLPTLYFIKKPVIPILFSKGCTYNCINCGGSQFSSRIINNRTCLAKKPPELVAKELLNISQSFNFPIRIIGDLRICGKRYYQKIFSLLGNYKIDNPTTFEFFTPATENYLKLIKKHFSQVSIELSPESGNQKVRMFQGRPFTNQGIFDMVKKLSILDNYIFIMWFQVGNALDTEESLNETVKFSEKIIKLDPKHIHPFISPLAPYIDPGSLAFEFPDKYGYIIKKKTLKEQIEGFNQPLWIYYLNYETKKLNLEQIIRFNYEYTRKFENIKFLNNKISEEAYNESIRLLNFLERLIFIIDKIWKEKGRNEVNKFLKKMNFDKTGLKIKRKLTEILFPEIKLYEYYKNFIKFSAYSIKNKFKNIFKFQNNY
ncbi:MAG: TIGR04190 family B12-binding domain/radical SAM domain protein [Promethearchaeia archaeon]